MTYGHDRLHPGSGDSPGPVRGAGSASSWQALGPDHRLAMIELALGHRRRAA